MNILGIDYGTKNIGLAWVNTSIGVVLPYGVIKIKNIVPHIIFAHSEKKTSFLFSHSLDYQKSKIKFNELFNLIKSERIDKIIVGLPLSLDGKENQNTERVRKFADELKKNTNVPVEFVNEMFSSRQADRLGGGVSRDEKAAMIILEDYLDKMSS